MRSIIVLPKGIACAAQIDGKVGGESDGKKNEI